MKTSEVLYRARDYIRDHGWIQGSFGERGGPRCMDGALLSVRDTEFMEWVSLDRYLDRVCGCLSMEFNDRHCKSADDAIAAPRNSRRHRVCGGPVMDMIYEALNKVLDDAGCPKIVRERCPWCQGTGNVMRDAHARLLELRCCTACAGNGYITVEAA